MCGPANWIELKQMFWQSGESFNRITIMIFIRTYNLSKKKKKTKIYIAFFFSFYQLLAMHRNASK